MRFLLAIIRIAVTPRMTLRPNEIESAMSKWQPGEDQLWLVGPMGHQ
jgi:hypothetical protein